MRIYAYMLNATYSFILLKCSSFWTNYYGKRKLWRYDKRIYLEKRSQHFSSEEDDEEETIHAKEKSSLMNNKWHYIMVPSSIDFFYMLTFIVLKKITRILLTEKLSRSYFKNVTLYIEQGWSTFYFSSSLKLWY